MADPFFPPTAGFVKNDKPGPSRTAVNVEPMTPEEGIEARSKTAIPAGLREGQMAQTSSPHAPASPVDPLK